MKNALLIAVALLFLMPMAAYATPQGPVPHHNTYITNNITNVKNVKKVKNVTKVKKVTKVKEVTKVKNVTKVTNVINDVEENYEQFDYGMYLDLVIYETKDKNIEIGIKNTWEVNRDEYTSLLGAKVNVWSIFKDKE